VCCFAEATRVSASSVPAAPETAADERSVRGVSPGAGLEAGGNPSADEAAAPEERVSPASPLPRTVDTDMAGDVARGSRPSAEGLGLLAGWVLADGTPVVEP
jgi:hypothetical protein